MKKWMKKVVALSFVAAQFLTIPNVSASSLEEVQNRKNTVTEEVTQLQKEVNVGLEEVSEITLALETLNREIEAHKATIDETEKNIEEQEILVKERFEYTADQLKALQKSEVNQNIILSLFQAESLTDLLNKIYTASVLTGASEQRLLETKEEQEKLNDLRATLLVEKEGLDEKQVTVVEQKEDLDKKVAQLRETLTANQNELAKLNEQETQIIREETERAARQRAEEARAAEARAAAEAAQTEPAQQAKVSVASATTPAPSKPAASSKPSLPATKPAEPAPAPSSTAGNWMTFQATGYSTQQPGLSTHTFTGIDLRVNPRVIAVDPSVIPLGSMVEVEGLGVYIAGDTGGAIKGNIIDIHYPTVSQALSWGRRNVRIRIIN